MNKHAKSIWKSWMEGTGETQYWDRVHKEWVDGDPNEFPSSSQPQNNPNKWRIKPETTTVCITYKVAVMNFGGEGVQLLLYGPESYECAEESDSFICWDTEERIVEVEVQV